MKLKELLKVVTDEHAIRLIIRNEKMHKIRYGFKNVLDLTTFDLNKTVTGITVNYGTIVIEAE